MEVLQTEQTSKIASRKKLRFNLRNSFPKPVRMRLLALLLIIVVGWLSYKAVRIGLYGWSAYQSSTEILQSVRNSPSPDTLIALQPQVELLSASAGGIEAEMRVFAPLLNALQGMTSYGSTMAAIPELLVVGAEMSALADDVLKIAAPGLLSGDLSLFEVLGFTVEQHHEQFPALAGRAARASAALQAIPAAQLPPALSERVAQVQSLVAMLEPAVRTAPAFPDLLGLRRPITYLLLIQNNHELRGTGGFISAAGELTLNRGEIEVLEITDSYSIFSREVEYSAAPEPIQKYLKSEILVFRDANWSPDLPTSARTARYFYEQVKGSSIQGVITIDLRSVQLLIDALDGIKIDGVEQRITGDNAVDVMKDLWSDPLSTDSTAQDNLGAWWKDRKDFVPLLAGAIIERVKSGKFSHLKLLTAVQSAMDERAIQIWLDNPEAATQLAALGWDGALRPIEDADYLALVDSNVGFNKVNAVLTRKIDYRVEWPNGPEQPALAVAEVIYTHPVTTGEEVCDQTPRYGQDYDDMIRRCFWNYVRLYVPRGSNLISIEGVEADSISSRRGEARTQVLAGFFSMKPGTQHTVTFTYELPPTLQLENYRLIAQRQAGSGALPLSWEVGAGQRNYQTLRGNWLDWNIRK
jgi:hypothetical protein